jgi:hypothetical protein
MTLCVSGLDTASTIARVGGLLVNGFGAILALKKESSLSKDKSKLVGFFKAVKDSIWCPPKAGRKFSHIFERACSLTMLGALSSYLYANFFLQESFKMIDLSLFAASIAFIASSVPAFEIFARKFTQPVPEGQKMLSWQDTIKQGRD